MLEITVQIVSLFVIKHRVCIMYLCMYLFMCLLINLFMNVYKYYVFVFVCMYLFIRVCM